MSQQLRANRKRKVSYVSVVLLSNEVCHIKVPIIYIVKVINS